MIDITQNLLYMIPIAVVIALAAALYFMRNVFSKDTGTPEMQKIAGAIKTGAMAYLARQYKTIGIISIILAVILTLLGFVDAFEGRLGIEVGIAFLIGAGFSILSGFIGMYISVSSNIRTASAARLSLNDAFKTSFRGGAISGIAVAALSLLGIFVLFLVFEAMSGSVDDSLIYILGYAFGASFAALFAQLGGGIYTKAADVGADLVGKVEAGIPEDDPRNPAVIADLVGDNVGDCAGRGADIFESTAAEIIGAMVIGLAVFHLATSGANEAWYLFPLVMMAFGLIASIVGIAVVRMKNENGDVMKSLNLGYYVTTALVIVFLAIATSQMLGDDWYYFFGCGIIGIILGLAVIYITQYYTSGSYRPVREIAEASETGPATNVITGTSIGMETTVMPILAIVLAIAGTFVLGAFAGGWDGGMFDNNEFVYGLFGTAVGTIAMLASSAFILAEDTFGPITDNAGGIAEMSNQPEEVRTRTDKLDSAGNTTKALTKGYAMASAALAAFLLFAAFFEVVANIQTEKTGILVTLKDAFEVNFGNPLVFVGALIGGMLVFFFAALAIKAVGKAAGEMIEEVRRQFREDPGIMDGTSDPDYGGCVDIATRSALKAMVLPALLPIVVPIAFGVIYRFAFPEFAPAAVGALIMAGTIVGILMANYLNNGGGAWDNAKKYIEEGNHGGKGSPAHAAAVVGDTVGDPFKDTAGPSIHVLVKLLSTICLVTAVLFIA